MSEDTVVVEQTEAQVATEKEARILGWVPKEDFRDGDHWVDAEAFVKRGKEINPILRKNNETLFKKLDEANREIAEIKQAAKEFGAFQKKEADKRVEELKTELAELKEKKKAAVSQGDGEAVVALDDAIDVIKEQQQEAKAVKVEVKPVVAVPKTFDPVITEWMEENKWFTTDDKMTRIADAIGVSINQNYPNLAGKAFFEQLDKELEEVLPSKYKKTARTSPVEANTQGSNRPVGSKKQSYENLPADAKAACDRLIKDGNKITREQYCSFYDWS